MPFEPTEIMPKCADETFEFTDGRCWFLSIKYNGKHSEGTIYVYTLLRQKKLGLVQESAAARILFSIGMLAFKRYFKKVLVTITLNGSYWKNDNIFITA